jgi:ADP-heptose:LPS heptosyltransferase
MSLSLRKWIGGRLRRWVVRGISGAAVPPAPGPDYAVAIVKLDRLGDFVLALAAIHALVQHHGAERCLLVVSPVAAPLAAREFPAVARIILPHSLGHWGALRTARRLRGAIGRLRVGQVVCLRHQRWDYDELVLSWFNVPVCVRTEDGFARRVHPEFRLYDCLTPGSFTPETPPVLTAGTGAWLCRELEWHRQVLARVLGRNVDDAEPLPTLRTEVSATGIVVAPLGSQAIKDFPAPLLRAAVRRATQMLGEPVTFIGEPAQEERLRRLAADCRVGAAPITVQAHLALTEYLAAVGRARLVISTDTATAHLAAAFDRPALIALGGGHYGQFGPWRRSSRQQWLTHHVDCFGCDWRCAFPEPYCLTHISELAVNAAIDRALAGA